MFELENIYLFYILLFLVALLYSSVGHGGSSGYQAVMVIFGFSALIIKPNALILNCIVSSFSFYHFYKEKGMQWSLFFVLVLSSIPMSMLGAYLEIPNRIFSVLLALCLIFSILYLNGLLNFVQLNIRYSGTLTLLIGSFLGFSSGILGIGGGIFLSPILFTLGWSSIGQTASISALFILVNSLAGLFSLYLKGSLNTALNYNLIPIVLVGGVLGSYIGSKKINEFYMKIFLSIVLLTAAIKMIYEQL